MTWRCVAGYEAPEASTNRSSFVFKGLDVEADGEGEGRTFFRNVRNCLPSETASHPVSTVSSTTPLRKYTKFYPIRWWSASRTDQLTPLFIGQSGKQQNSNSCGMFTTFNSELVGIGRRSWAYAFCWKATNNTDTSTLVFLMCTDPRVNRL